MSDLATVLDAQGRYEEAHAYSRRAAELARDTQHPEEHMVLNNLAAILMHKGQWINAQPELVLTAEIWICVVGLSYSAGFGGVSFSLSSLNFH